SRPGPYGVGARLVVDETQREIETQSIAAVTVVRNPDWRFLPVLCVYCLTRIWEKFPKFGTDFQGAAAQDISREQGGMSWRVAGDSTRVMTRGIGCRPREWIRRRSQS